MTDQEIEKLREKLGSEYSVKRLNGAITVELVDIWKGVEFAECVTQDFPAYTEGDIYPITGIQDGYIKTMYDDFLSATNGIAPDYFKPSTESAYVEQLKAKANELYGEIKDGDRFEGDWIGDGVERSIYLNGKYDFHYEKETDELDLYGFLLYTQGKWAKKVDRVRVVPSEIHYPIPDSSDQYVTVELRIILGLLDSTKSKGVADELAKCLENYLNKS